VPRDRRTLEGKRTWPPQLSEVAVLIIHRGPCRRRPLPRMYVFVRETIPLASQRIAFLEQQPGRALPPLALEDVANLSMIQ
jgi:hypothetical protein